MLKEEHYNFKPDTVIALRFKVAEVALDQVERVFDTLKTTFPTHKIIAFPEDVMDLQEMELDTLINFRDYLTQIIDEKTKD